VLAKLASIEIHRIHCMRSASSCVCWLSVSSLVLTRCALLDSATVPASCSPHGHGTAFTREQDRVRKKVSPCDVGQLKLHAFHALCGHEMNNDPNTEYQLPTLESKYCTIVVYRLK